MPHSNVAFPQWPRTGPMGGARAGQLGFCPPDPVQSPCELASMGHVRAIAFNETN